MAEGLKWETITPEKPNREVEVREKKNTQPALLPEIALPAENLRRQGKIIDVIESNNYFHLGTPEVEVSPATRREFIEKIRRHEITTGTWKRFLFAIQSGVNEPEDVQGWQDLFDKALSQRDPRILTMLQLVSHSDNDKTIKSGGLMLEDLMHAFPTPLDLEARLQSSRENFSDLLPNSPEDKKIFYRDLENIMFNLYGRQQDYWQQIRLLISESKLSPIERDKTATHENMIRETQEFEKVYTQNLDQQADRGLIESIIAKVEIHADPFNGRMLTKDFLIEHGLGPSQKMMINEQTVWFSSRAYAFGSDRVAVIAYVEQEGKMVPRSYYLSNSQGVWRYLPHYQSSSETGKEEIVWYSKGYGEESVTLPFPLQEALSRLSVDEKNLITLAEDDQEFVFAGTARNLISFFRAMPAKPSKSENAGTYIIETDKTSKQLPGNFYTIKEEYGSHRKVPPEFVEFFDESAKPDFSNLVASWEQQSRVYGLVKNEVYLSGDKQWNYVFCKTEKSDQNPARLWIGGVEDAKSQIQSTGLRKAWVNGGDLTTPAIEYYSQAGGFGDGDDIRGNYIGMQRYIDQIPLIQQYRRHFNIGFVPTAPREEKGFNQKHQEYAQEAISKAGSYDRVFDVLDQLGGLFASDGQFIKAPMIKHELKKLNERYEESQLPKESVEFFEQFDRGIIGQLGVYLKQESKKRRKEPMETKIQNARSIDELCDLLKNAGTEVVLDGRKFSTYELVEKIRNAITVYEQLKSLEGFARLTHSGDLRRRIEMLYFGR